MRYDNRFLGFYVFVYCNQLRIKDFFEYALRKFTLYCSLHL